MADAEMHHHLCVLYIVHLLACCNMQAYCNMQRTVEFELLIAYIWPQLAPAVQ